MRRLICAAVILMIAVGPVSGWNDDWRMMFKSFYEEGLRKNGIVGSSFMLIRDGAVIDRHYYGLANIDKKQAVDENTIYHWASITKTFTAVAIMQLRDRGFLKLDDPIIKYVPELAAVQNRYGSMSDITIRQLMSHSAGFRAATWPWGGSKDWHPHEPKEWSQLVAMMPYTQIEFLPGSKFSYSNPGIVFLGRVIEKVSGEDYEVYIDKNIFKPLEMYRSYFDTTPAHLMSHRSHSYSRAGESLKPGRFDVDTGITVSNGGLNSPFPDMAKYFSFLMGSPANESVLKKSSIEEMWKPQIKISDTESMGLSFFLEDSFGRHLISHSGHQNNFASHFYIEPSTRTAYVVAYNTFVGTEKEPSSLTDKLDLQIKNYVVEKLFPR